MGGPATIVNPAASVPSGAVGQAAATAAAANQSAPPPLIQAYDPTNQTPYQAPVLPDTGPAAPTAADALGPNQNIQDFGAASPAAGAAAIGNQLLRGVMQGVAVHQVAQAQQLHRTSQALQGNLDSASQDVYNLAKQGVDPNDPQMQAAQDRKNVAWKSMMDFYGQHVPGVQIDPKTGQPKPNKVSILDRLRGNDPAQVPSALYEGMLKAGPPVDHQIAQFQTPQYKQYLAQQGAGVAATQAAGIAQQQSVLGESQLQKKVYDLAALPTRTPEQEQELDTARIALSKFGMGSRDKKVSTYVGTDGLQHDVMQTPFGTTYEIPSGTGVRTPAMMHPKTAWIMVDGKPASVLLDDNNQPRMETINHSAIPPSYLLPQIRSGYTTFVGADNHMYQIPTSTSTQHVLPRGSSGAPATAIAGCHRVRCVLRSLL